MSRKNTPRNYKTDNCIAAQLLRSHTATYKGYNLLAAKALLLALRNPKLIKPVKQR